MNHNSEKFLIILNIFVFVVYTLFLISNYQNNLLSNVVLVVTLISTIMALLALISLKANRILPAGLSIIGGVISLPIGGFMFIAGGIMLMKSRGQKISRNRLVLVIILVTIWIAANIISGYFSIQKQKNDKVQTIYNNLHSQNPTLNLTLSDISFILQKNYEYAQKYPLSKVKEEDKVAYANSLINYINEASTRKYSPEEIAAVFTAAVQFLHSLSPSPTPLN